jgi:hypothetical protein
VSELAAVNYKVLSSRFFSRLQDDSNGHDTQTWMRKVTVANWLRTPRLPAERMFSLSANVLLL